MCAVICRVVLLFVFLSCFSPSYASTLWTKIPSNALPPANALSQIKVAANIQNILDITTGDSIEIPINGGQTLTVNFDDFKNDNGVQFFYGRIDGYLSDKSEIMLIYDADKITGHVLLKELQRSYEIDIDVSQADGFITQYLYDHVFCEIPSQAEALARIDSENQNLALAPTSTNVFNLSSTNDTSVLYIDADGETVSDSTWTRRNGGRTIVAQPFDIDGNPSVISNHERANIYTIWKIVSEDFRPFAINVTTSLAKYNTAPRNRRQRVILTPTNFYGNVGGVAQVGSFSRNSDTVAWAFNRSFDSARRFARIISHEAGHTFRLNHDGLNGAEYHLGSGSGEVYGWAPIMGAAFYGRHVQWSRGDYAGATNGENDIAIIASQAGGRSDSYANNNQARTKVVGSYNGYIGANGDKDVFYLDGKKGDKVSLSVTVNETYSDLDTEIRIYSSSGTLLASRNETNPFNQPQKMGSSLNYTLPQNGRYYVHVLGGAYNGGSYRWSRYGSVGQYQLTGKILHASGSMAPIYLLLLDDD